MKWQHRIPLHGTQDDMERLSLHADSASLNPDGFRQPSEKTDRKRVAGGRNRKANSKKRPRFLTRAERLAEGSA